MSLREEQKAQREEAILLTALTMFVKKGYMATKTSDISKALHISEGLLFHYFKSKEALLEALIDVATQTNNAWINMDELQPLDYFYAIADSILRLLKEEAIGAKFFVLIAHIRQFEGCPPHLREKVMPNNENTLKLKAMVQMGQEQGVIREGDPEALLYLYSNTLNAIAIGYTAFERMPLPEAEWIVDMLRKHEK